MTNYPSNSHKSKETPEEVNPPKRIEKVISGKAHIKQKSGIRKFTEVFLQEDINSVKDYILIDVVVPAIKTAITDVVKNGIDMMMYGETGFNNKKTPGTKISYRQYYNSSNNRHVESREPNEIHATCEYNEVVIGPNRGEAEDVLMQLNDQIELYGLIRVSDFYDAVGITGSHTDYNYGWTDIRTARIVRSRDGYMIKFPKAVPLD